MDPQVLILVVVFFGLLVLNVPIAVCIALATIVTKAVSGGCEGVIRVPPVFTTVHNAATGS